MQCVLKLYQNYSQSELLNMYGSEQLLQIDSTLNELLNEITVYCPTNYRFYIYATQFILLKGEPKINSILNIADNACGCTKHALFHYLLRCSNNTVHVDTLLKLLSDWQDATEYNDLLNRLKSNTSTNSPLYNQNLWRTITCLELATGRMMTEYDGFIEYEGFIQSYSGLDSRMTERSFELLTESSELVEFIELFNPSSDNNTCQSIRSILINYFNRITTKQLLENYFHQNH
jgi:hypothetical protein